MFVLFETDIKAQILVGYSSAVSGITSKPSLLKKLIEISGLCQFKSYNTTNENVPVSNFKYLLLQRAEITLDDI